jgi:hypothetical protein
MQGRFRRKRIFRGGGAVLLVLGALVILTLMARRHEVSSDVIRRVYKTTRERFGGGGREQPRRQEDTDVPSEQDDEVLLQERNREEETEASSTEAEEISTEEIRSIIRESVRRSQEGSGGEVESQSGETTAAPEGTRKNAKEPPIEGYDSLSLGQVTQKLLELSVEEIEQLRDYEAQNRNRPSVMQRFERRLRAASENLKRRDNGEGEERSGEEVRRIIRESVRRSAGEQ